MSHKLRCVSADELFGKKQKSNDRAPRRAEKPAEKLVQPRARPPTTQPPAMPKDIPEVGFEVWGAPPPPPPGVESGESSGFHGWSHIHDPIEAAAMHRELIEVHYASLVQHFRMMWHHQNMANQANAAAEGVPPQRLPPPQLPLPPPPVMIPNFGSPAPPEVRSQLPLRTTDRRDGDDDQNSQGLTDQSFSKDDSSKDADSAKDSDA